jgi:hypothetical protein
MCDVSILSCYSSKQSANKRCIAFCITFDGYVVELITKVEFSRLRLRHDVESYGKSGLFTVERYGAVPEIRGKQR